MTGDEVPETVAERARGHIHPPQLMSQVGDIDAHRTRSRAEAVPGASLLPRVGIFLLKRPQTSLFRGGRIRQLPQGGDLTLRGDPGPGRKREAAGKAVHLAESALDAFVQFLVDLRQLRLDSLAVIRPRFQHRQRLEILQEALRIIVEDHTRIQKPVRVKQFLHPLHYPERLPAPLVLHERSHIPARSVLGLQGAVIFPDHHLRHVADHRLIAPHLRLGIKRLVDDEMEVALKGVAVDAGIVVAMPVQQRRKILRRVRQILDVEGDVLDKAGRPFAAHSSDGREYSRTDGPVVPRNGRIATEYERVALRVIQYGKTAQNLGEFADVGIQVRLVSTRDAKQESGQILVGIFIKHRVIY